MELAKPRVDIGLSTNDLEPMLAFWQGPAGVPFDHLLKIRRGQDQHRHDANGSVLKINHYAEPLPDTPPSGYRLAVRDLAAHRRFYAEALGLTEEPRAQGAAFRAGETLLILEESPDAPADAGMQGKGWRYITFQVFKVDEELARILAKGGREAVAPVTLGTTARISMVRDPDGNWIEISQRASIVGSLT